MLEGSECDLELLADFVEALAAFKLCAHYFLCTTLEVVINGTF